MCLPAGNLDPQSFLKVSAVLVVVWEAEEVVAKVSPSPLEKNKTIWHFLGNALASPLVRLRSYLMRAYFAYLWLVRNEGLDPYGSPSSFHSFIPYEPGVREQEP